LLGVVAFIVCVSDVAVKAPPGFVSNRPVALLLVMTIVTVLWAALPVSDSGLPELFRVCAPKIPFTAPEVKSVGPVRSNPIRVIWFEVSVK
jgi:hypothetical protein